jgi:hypothetical protein
MEGISKTSTPSSSHWTPKAKVAATAVVGTIVALVMAAAWHKMGAAKALAAGGVIGGSLTAGTALIANALLCSKEKTKMTEKEERIPDLTELIDLSGLETPRTATTSDQTSPYYMPDPLADLF